MSHLQLHSRAEQLVNFLEKTVGTFNPHLVHNSSLHAFPRRIVLPKKSCFCLGGCSKQLHQRMMPASKWRNISLALSHQSGHVIVASLLINYIFCSSSSSHGRSWSSLCSLHILARMPLVHYWLIVSQLQKKVLLTTLKKCSTISYKLSIRWLLRCEKLLPFFIKYLLLCFPPNADVSD